MRVIGVEGEPMRVIKKTVRRRRKVKTIKSKMRFTVLRCLELTILNGEEGKDDQSQWVREESEGMKSE